MLPRTDPPPDDAAPLRLASEAGPAGPVRRRGLHTIRDLPLAVSEAGSCEEAMATALSRIAEAAGWRYGEAWLIEDEGRMAAACAAHDAIGEPIREFASIFEGTRIPAGEGLPGIAVRERCAVWVSNLAALDPETFLRRGRGLEAGFRSAAILPLLAQGEVEGVLVFFLRQGEALDRREQRILAKAVLPLGDLLRHHRLERELRRRDLDLERRLEESRARADRLAEQVREADRWATVGTFAAGVVHDLTNSLFPLRCRTDLLRRMELPEKALAHVEAIDAAIRYLDRLAANLRSLCRGDADAAPGAPTCCLASWWQEHRRLVQGQLGQDVSLHAILEPDLPPVLVGEDTLTRMVVALADQAARALGDSGSVTVSASLEDDRRHVRFRIADDGPGMTALERRDAFSASDRDRLGVGRGFGLATVRGLVERCGGSIEIDSSDGRGTRISLMLPVAEPDAEPPPVSIAASDPRIAGMVSEFFRLLHDGPILLQPPGASHDDAGILVVDADAPGAEVARRFVEGSPGRVVLALGRGGEAWRGIPATVVEDPSNAGALRDGVAQVVAERRRSALRQEGDAT